MYNITFRYYYDSFRYHKFTKKFNTLSEVAEFMFRSLDLHFDDHKQFTSRELKILVPKIQSLRRKRENNGTV